MAAKRARVYATSPYQMTSMMLELEADWEDTYPQFVNYPAGLLERREEWTLCLRDCPEPRPQHQQCGGSRLESLQRLDPTPVVQ